MAADDDNEDGGQPSQTGAALRRGTQPETGGLYGRWSDWLGDPKNQAALIGFGAQMMQPRSAGQTFMGSVGQALSTGGEAARNVEKGELAEREVTSKEQQREATAQLAEERARGAGSAAYFREQQQALMSEVHPMNAYLRHQQGIVNQNKLIDAENEKGELNATPQRPYTPREHVPVPTYDEFLQNYFPKASGRGAVGVGSKGTGGSPVDPADEAVLRRNPSPENRRKFDGHYGAGSADQVLGRLRSGG